jgi:hypothetical protein
MTKSEKQALLIGSITMKALCRVKKWNYSHFHKVMTGKTPCGRTKARTYLSEIGGTESDWMCGCAETKEKMWRQFVSDFTEHAGN